MITPFGLQVADRAKAVLREAEEVMEVARAARSPMTGEMRLGVIPTIGPFVLPRVFPALRERFPELTIYLREEQTAPLLTRLEDGELDAALIALPYDTGDLCIDVIMEDELLFACNRNHALAGADEVSLETLAGEQLMLLEEGHCLRGHTLDVCTTSDRRARAQFEASSLLTMVQMVAAGIGVALIPRLAVDAHVTQGTGSLPFTARRAGGPPDRVGMAPDVVENRGVPAVGRHVTGIEQSCLRPSDHHVCDSWACRKNHGLSPPKRLFSVRRSSWRISPVSLDSAARDNEGLR